MANGANRLFGVIKNTSEEMQPIQSQYVTLTVKSLNPLILNKDDRLDITEDFCVFSTTFDKTALHLNDILAAIILNNGQLYYISTNLSLDSTVAETINQILDDIGQITNISETLPVGSEIDFDGNVEDIPTGWQEIPDPTEYSTTERRIGTWIDGKPIYRIAINVTIGTSESWTDLATITNMEKAIQYFLVGTQAVHPRYESSNYYCNLLRDGNKIRYKAKGQAGDYVLIVEYTKTTDVVNS